MPIEDWFPKGFDLSAFKTGIKSYDAMIILNEKSYLLWKDEKIIRHGSGLLGRNQPKICHVFLEDLAKTIFAGDAHPEAVLEHYSDLGKYPITMFTMSTTVTKDEYFDSGMYAGLMRQLKHAGIKVEWGNRFKFVKTKQGYTPTVLLTSQNSLDYDYYKERLVDVYCKLTFVKPTARLCRQLISIMNNHSKLEKWNK